MNPLGSNHLLLRLYQQGLTNTYQDYTNDTNPVDSKPLGLAEIKGFTVFWATKRAGCAQNIRCITLREPAPEML